MESVNGLGALKDTVVLTVVDCTDRRVSFDEMAKKITDLLVQNHPKWNWIVACGDSSDLQCDRRRAHSVMFDQIIGSVRVVVVRGSPLERYEGGPASVCVLRNSLPLEHIYGIKSTVERSNGNFERTSEAVRLYLESKFPADNWIVVVGDEFALSQDYEMLPGVAFCATIGSMSLVVFKL